MNLYLISQSVTKGYDRYSDAVVAAMDHVDAEKMHPNGSIYDGSKEWGYAWAPHPENVRVELIGVAVEGTVAGVICASFHAG